MRKHKPLSAADEAEAVRLLESLERLVGGELVKLTLAQMELAHRSEAFAKLRYRVFEELDNA